jgi:hypothetical protein
VSPLSLVCYYVIQCITVRLIKKHFGEKDVEAVLQRLDRLTEDETQTMTMEILRVIHAIVQNMNLVMGSINGEQMRSASYPVSVEHSSLSLDRKSSIDSVLDGVQETLGTYYGDSELALCLTEH